MTRIAVRYCLIFIFLFFSLYCIGCSRDNTWIVVRETNEVSFDLTEINDSIRVDSVLFLIFSLKLDSNGNQVRDSLFVNEVVHYDTVTGIADTFSFIALAKVEQDLRLTMEVYYNDKVIAALDTVTSFDGLDTSEEIVAPTKYLCISPDDPLITIHCIDSLNKVNQPPKTYNIPITAIAVGDEYLYVPVVDDPEGDSLLFSSNVNISWIKFDSIKGGLSGTPEIEDVGVYKGISIWVTDKYTRTNVANFDLVVKNISILPVITAIPNQTVPHGSLFEPIDLNEYVTDELSPDSLLTWEVSSLNAVATNIEIVVSPNNILTFEPINEWYGTDTINLKVTNEQDSSSQKRLLLTVYDNTQNTLKIFDIPNQTIKMGESFKTIKLGDYAVETSSSMLWFNEPALDLTVVYNSDFTEAAIVPGEKYWVGSEEITFIVYNGNNDTLKTKAAFTVETDNIARLKSVNQSSTEWSLGAEKAIDGNTEGHMDSSSITHTSEGEVLGGPGTLNPWWEIDLGEETFVSAIEIFNRTDQFADRLQNFHILFSNAVITSDDPAQAVNESSISIIKDSVENGVVPYLQDSVFYSVNRFTRFVRVQLLNSFTILSLAEVRIFSEKIHPVSINPGTQYTITTDNTGGGASWAINVFGGNKSTENIGSWHADGGLNQRWYIEMKLGTNKYLMRNYVTDLCVEIDEVSFEAMHRVCDNTVETQLFYIDFENGHHYLRNAALLASPSESTPIQRYLTIAKNGDINNPNQRLVWVAPKDSIPEQQHVLIRVAPVGQY